MDLANNNQKKIRINKKIPQSLPEIGTFSRIVFSVSVSAKTEKFILALVYVSAKNKIGFFQLLSVSAEIQKRPFGPTL